MSGALPRAATRFTVPPDGSADRPAERRGLARDGVRLLVARPGGIAHGRFTDLPQHLDAGDLLVLNTSATLPAAVDARRADGSPLPVHVSTTLDDGSWVVEPRLADGTGPDRSVTAGEALALPGGLTLRLVEPYRAPPPPSPHSPKPRLWQARPTPATTSTRYLPGHGRPIEYGYLAGRYSLADHQTVYARHPGSAEMPSAGRPFTAELLVRLVARGVVLAPVVLHCQVSSPDAGEPPLPERFEVPADTARLVRGTRRAGRRVVAVGTTVVRALESAVGPDGLVRAAGGWTDLVIGPEHPTSVVTGLISGLHEPAASHLLMLEAVAGAGLVQAAYGATAGRGYLWHEFGDIMVFLP